MERHEVELVGGPLDGQVVELFKGVREFQQAVLDGGYQSYVETVRQTDGRAVFEYVGRVVPSLGKWG